eukprot:4221986-Amphidinium_carterae.1
MGMLPRRCRCPHCGGKVNKDGYYAEVNSYHYRCRHHSFHSRVNSMGIHFSPTTGGRYPSTCR